MRSSSSKKSLLTFLYFLCLLGTCIAQDSYQEKHLEVALRMIGHQLLLNSNDSTSRVLPVKKEGNQYQIEFESELEFNPDSLIKIVNTVLLDQQITDGYIVEVAECESEKVVYSFEIANLDTNTMIPCRTREVPKACYRILLTIHQPTQSFTSEETKSQAALYVILVSLLGLLVGFLWYRKSRKPNQVVNLHLIRLGKFQFDQRKAELILEEQRTELSGKEADLLLLLHSSANTTIEREVILNKVWGDEGDYIGRTLDVFISKLRKKLEADPSIKIVNVRGVGYKMVLG